MKPLYTEEEFTQAKSKNKLACQCYQCGNTFLTAKNLIKFELEHNRGRIKFCSILCGGLFNHPDLSKEVSCANCNKMIFKKQHEIKRGKNVFCSHSCSASYNNLKRTPRSEESKKKTSESLYFFYGSEPGITKVKIRKEKRLYAHKMFIKITNCEFCKKEIQTTVLTMSAKVKKFCDINCFHGYMKTDVYRASMVIVGRRSAQTRNKRSKNEIYFYDLCKEKFGNVLANEPMFNGWDADVILPDFKIAALWNGKWHYEKIREGHSVLQVQNRDKIKIKEIGRAGYVPYTIKDMGKYSKRFVKIKFEEFLDYLKINNYIC